MCSTDKISILLGVALVMVGCASAPPPKDALLWKARALTDHVAQTGQSITTVNLETLQPGYGGKISETADYRQEALWWCAAKNFDEWAATRNAFSELCRRQDGVYQDGFCSSNRDRERVLFMAKVTRFNDLCSQVEALVLAPTTSPDNPRYWGRLLKEGFQTTADLRAKQSEQEQRRLRLANAAEQDRRREEIRLSAELPHMRKRGASICKQEPYSGITYQAYVEEFTEDKLRILVSQAFLTHNSSMSPGGFQQHIEWVYPVGWYLCERKAAR